MSETNNQNGQQVNNDTNDIKDLTNNIYKDKIIEKLKNVGSNKNIFILIILGIFFFQFIFIGMQCSQINFYKQRTKMNYLSTYQVEQKIMKEGRKKNAMRKIMKVALKYRPSWNERKLCKIAELIYDIGECVYGIPTEEWIILFSLESKWYYKARSPVGARGIGQLMPVTGRLLAKDLNITWEGEKTFYNAYENVRMSMRYYWYLKCQYEKPEYYISAYNWGPTAIGRFYVKDKKLKGKHRKYLYKDFIRTKKYVEKILGEIIIIEGLEINK